MAVSKRHSSTRHATLARGSNPAPAQRFKPSSRTPINPGKLWKPPPSSAASFTDIAVLSEVVPGKSRLQLRRESDVYWIHRYGRVVLRVVCVCVVVCSSPSGTALPPASTQRTHPPLQLAQSLCSWPKAMAPNAMLRSAPPLFPGTVQRPINDFRPHPPTRMHRPVTTLSASCVSIVIPIIATLPAHP